MSIVHAHGEVRIGHDVHGVGKAHCIHHRHLRCNHAFFMHAVDSKEWNE